MAAEKAETAMDDPFFVRNLVYGVEDSLISTTGVVVGVAWSGLARRDIIVTGLILVLVEALSMSFGAFVSEDAFMSHDGTRQPASPTKIVGYAAVMLVSYALAGLIPLAPFLLGAKNAWRYSVGLAVVALVALVFLAQPKERGVKKRALKAGALASVGTLILAISIGAGRVLQ
jgi:VIT1/CCC1 family predicted Fe2+/Mn2+ transporter